MAINRTSLVRFYYESSTGVFYDISINYDTGVGTARSHGSTIKSANYNSLTETALTVDSGSLAAWQAYHNSRRAYAAVYNTAQDLASVLT